MKTKVNAQKIKEMREQRGWSQNQLANMSCISLRTIQRMEKDGSSSMESVKSLASVFEVDFKELLEEEDSKKFKGVDFLTRIEHGKQIADLMGDKEASDFDFELSIKDKELIDLIHTFFQNLRDYNDIWGNIEFGGRGEAINYFQELIDELHNRDLWVFGGQTKKEYGNYTPLLMFNVIVIRIHPKDSATIIKVDLSQPSVSSVSSN
jgi:transcriptional regulator with XRE-family HTH domain